MRIIAGANKGRTLKAPKWDGLRPTSDKLRETLFNILADARRRRAGARRVCRHRRDRRSRALSRGRRGGDVFIEQRSPRGRR